MKLKKMISCLSMVLVLVMLTAVPAFAAETCTHQWENSGDCTATCTEAGYQPQTCSLCGSTRQKYVAATGHSWVDNGECTATCTKDGYQPQVCSVCGSTRQKPVSATGQHSWVDSGECTATCSKDGYQPQTCSICGSTRQKPVSATGQHSWVDSGASTATCTESGYQPQTCSVCGSTRQKPVSALGHTPAAAVRENEIPATATAAGSYDSVVYCSVCHAELSRETMVIPATGPVACEHKNTKVQGAKEATCTEAGYTGDTVCTDCGKTVKAGTAIPAAGHTETILPAVEADCMHPGLTEGKECSVCGEILVAQKNLGLGDHVMKDGKCVVCGYQKPASSTAELDDVPKTGDSTNMVIYGAAVLVSLLGISALLFKRKLAR